MPTTIYAPDGPVGRPREKLTPPPPSLGGLRIGVLDNRKPNAGLLLTLLAEVVVARTGARLGPVVEKGTAATPCEPDGLARLLAEADVVLTGSAD